MLKTLLLVRIINDLVLGVVVVYVATSHQYASVDE